MLTSTAESGRPVVGPPGNRRRGSPDGDEWRGHEYVTARQAADYLGVHYRTIHRYAASGFLTPLYLAGLRSVRFARVEVEGLLRGPEEGEG